MTPSAGRGQKERLVASCGRAKAIPNCSIQLGVSKIPDAGIGVFAIIPISKGEYPFVSEEAAPSILISESEFVKAPSYIQKLILHYCEIHNDGYYVPSDFRHIDASWFLNHSDNPNIDSTLLTALRDIKPGEELTVNYHGPPINMTNWTNRTNPMGGVSFPL